MDSLEKSTIKIGRHEPLRCAAGLLLLAGALLISVSHAQSPVDDAGVGGDRRPAAHLDARRFSLDSLAERAVDRDQMFAYELVGPDTGSQPAASGASSGASGASAGSTSLALYKEPSSWMVSILKEMFTDIDWRTIEDARIQIIKFIHKAERFAGAFRNLFGRNGDGDGVESREAGRSFSGRWWSGKGDKSGAAKVDAQRVKEMLERVACFVGYARLMNLSNEALAELDAAKVVTNLFGSLGGGGAKRNSSGWKFWG